MGIKLLSKFLRLNCGNNIRISSLSKYRGKTIIIDTSIYLYKFKSTNDLLSNMFLMCSIFKKYKIKPLFVFDGISGEEKEEELQRRREQKKLAKHEYYKILESENYNEKKDKQQLKELQRKFVKVYQIDINNVKLLFDYYGITYYQAEGEADELCAYLIHNNIGDIVMSDDMDLFVYGCPIILRNVDLINRTCLEYNLNSILKKLSINMEDFKLLCLCSGSDYYKSEKTIFHNYNVYKFKKKNQSYKEIMLKDDTLSEKIKNVSLMFDVTNKNINFQLKINNDIYKSKLHKLLEMENFIFVR